MPKKPDRTSAVHTWLAWASLLWALFAYSAPTLRGQDSRLRMLDAQPSPITRIAYATDTYGVTLIARADGPPDLRVRYAAAQNELQVPARIWRGGPAAAALFADLTMLPAQRALGPTGPEQLARFSLAPPEASLELESAQARHVVALGAAVYGSNDLYAYLPERGAYIIDAALIAPLMHGASSLIDARIWPVPRDGVRAITLSARGQSRKFQMHTPLSGPGFLAEDMAAPRPNPNITRLMQQLMDLAVTGNVDAAPQGPPSASLIVEPIAGEPAHVALYLPAANDSSEAVVVCDHQRGPMSIARAAALALAHELDALDPVRR